jgi:hypothetical protein
LKNDANLDIKLLALIAAQLVTKNAVEVEGQSLPVRRTSAHRLKAVSFTMHGQQYQAIEQNPDKPSHRGKLAREGHNVVQFKSLDSNAFVAVAVDGKVVVYD